MRRGAFRWGLDIALPGPTRTEVRSALVRTRLPRGVVTMGPSATRTARSGQKAALLHRPTTDAVGRGSWQTLYSSGLLVEFSMPVPGASLGHVATAKLQGPMASMNPRVDLTPIGATLPTASDRRCVPDGRCRRGAAGRESRACDAAALATAVADE